jgi:phosphomannomutase/phosphoglucomutase
VVADLQKTSLVIESISGLRGIYDRDLTIAYVKGWASRFAAFTGEGDIAIGCDTRPSSEALLKSVADALSGAGCVVHRLGLVATPEIFRYVRVSGMDGGVMVTASHNPPEWNGLKFITKDGMGISEEELLAIRESHPTFSPGRVEPASSPYYDDILRRVGPDSGTGVKVGLDLGGGSATKSATQLFEMMGAEVHAINMRAGAFNRTVDPTEDPLAQLSQEVVSHRCDVGFAFDGDGDRLVVMDAEGTKLPPDTIFALMASEIVKEDDMVAISVDTSSAVAEIVRNKGGKVVLAPVGEANVVRTMLDTRSSLGGEGSSGGVIFPDFSYCRDGLLAAALLVRSLRRSALTDILADLPSYSLERLKMTADRPSFEKALGVIRREHPDSITLDGVRLEGSHGWMLFRASRTEDAVRISVEARSQKELPAAVEEAKALLSRAMSSGAENQ